MRRSKTEDRGQDGVLLSSVFSETGHIIKEVQADSSLTGKVSPGDALLAIDNHAIEDVLDYEYRSYEPRLTLTVRLKSGKVKRVRVRKGEGEPLGLTFDSFLMSRERSCSNRCVFCFIDQLPKGMRRTLYFKDDDTRLSFLTGSYITLTNLTERDIARMIELRISPVNVSVQATAPELRAKLLGNPNGSRGYDTMKRLADAGITMNCQIVLCPGLNDGAALDRSMEGLRALYDAVASVSVVPVGLTKYRENLYPLEPFDAELAASTIDQVDTFGMRCLDELGTRLFYCADELYLKAGRDIPDDTYYEDYPQLENGVGLMRLFESSFMDELEAYGGESAAKSQISIATGLASAGFLQRLVQAAEAACGNINAQVYGIANEFFGPNVDVAGLITGADLIAGLKGKDLGDRLLIPSTMLRHGEGVFLDDVTLSGAEAALNVEVVPVTPDGGEFFRQITDNI